MRVINKQVKKDKKYSERWDQLAKTHYKNACEINKIMGSIILDGFCFLFLGCLLLLPLFILASQFDNLTVLYLITTHLLLFFSCAFLVGKLVISTKTLRILKKKNECIIEESKEKYNVELE